MQYLVDVGCGSGGRGDQARWRAWQEDCHLFDVCTAADVTASVGVSHAYDLVHILGRAIEQARGTDRALVRDALETVRNYSGLTRHFDPPFTPEQHDALDASSFQLGYFDANGTIRPLDDGAGSES